MKKSNNLKLMILSIYLQLIINLKLMKKLIFPIFMLLFSCGNEKVDDLNRQIQEKDIELDQMLDESEANRKWQKTEGDFLMLESEAIDLIENPTERADKKRAIAKRLLDFSNKIKLEEQNIQKKQNEIDSLENVLNSL
jgi:hypothetical protein